MVDLGTDPGVRTVALLTDMPTPLGLTAGNALEVRESVEVLAGGGPADVVELTLALAREMLAAAGPATDADPADALADGSAMDVWRRMIARPGRRPGRAAAHRPRAARRHGPGGRRPDPPGRATPSASPPGGSARAAPARRTRCRPARASSCTPSPAPRYAAGEPLLTLHTDTPERFEGALADARGGVRGGAGGIAPGGYAARTRPCRLSRRRGRPRRAAAALALRRRRGARPALLDGERADGARVAVHRAGPRGRWGRPHVRGPDRGAVAADGRPAAALCVVGACSPSSPCSAGAGENWRCGWTARCRALFALPWLGALVAVAALVLAVYLAFETR